MTTLFLSTAAGALGNSILGAAGKFAGAELGTYVGAKLDNFLFGLDKTLPTIHTARSNDLNIQTSTYGKVIPIVYGTVKIAGNVIWAMPIKELEEESQITFGKLGTQTSRTSITYSYYSTLAIAICSGLAHQLINIYANEQIIDQNSIKYRFYQGTEEQRPDHLIATIEDKAPAYRGIAYIVLEDFPLAEYGNKIPNFTFEISCNIESKITQKIENINIIPGSGEFVYDTKIQSKTHQEHIDNRWIQSGQTTRINQNSNQDLPDAILSLNNMKQTLPNLQWISVVINWFCDDLDISRCAIYPATEYKHDARSIPDDWRVASITREEARLISYDNERPRYGGTISDNSLVRYLKELQERGYQILIYPMLLLDTRTKPWRGYISGEASDVDAFFQKYNSFIIHYANLTREFASGFVIGSELKGITQLNSNNSYPAISALVKLAKSVRNIMGTETIITYAANWDEYHSHNARYYMDELWASPYIDVVGIDAYFPLTDQIQPSLGFSSQDISNSWCTGEGYDYYYEDSENHADQRAFIDAKWAWKNIEKWWGEKHVNNDGLSTTWQPRMKKVWFVEYGFSSVDGCANQPNVFIDINSIDSKFPFFSKGNIDFKAQAIAIEGTLHKWQDSQMVERMFLWAWDARPFPYFPNLLKVWSDGPSWEFSHTIQGKLIFPTLNNVVANILKKAGYTDADFNCNQLTQFVDGFILNDRYTARSAIEILQQTYFFDIFVKEKQIIFQPKISEIKLNLDQNDLVKVNNSSFSITQTSSSHLPNRIEIIYINRMRNYDLSSTYSELEAKNKNIKTLFLPLVLNDYYAQSISYILLSHILQTKTKYTFNLPNNLLTLQPNDVIKLTLNNIEHTVKISSIDYGKILHVTGTSHANSIYEIDSTNFSIYTPPQKIFPGETEFTILDLPMNSEGISIAKNGIEEGWQGASLYISDQNNENYHFLANLSGNTTCGICTNRLHDGPTNIIDEGNNIVVLLKSGELDNITEEELLNGGNLAKIGDEIIQFRNSKFISNHKYQLSGLLRGRYNTEHLINSHISDETFILLNSLVQSVPMKNDLINMERSYKGISYGQTDSQKQIFIYHNNYLKPFSVVRISGHRNIDNDIVITWIRRSRIENNLRDHIDLPIDEETEQYDIEIYRNNKTIRTMNTLNSTSIKYSSEHQIEDFNSLQTTLSVKVYQISAIVGRGNSVLTNIRIQN